MKKFLTFLAIVAAAAMTLSSCNNDGKKEAPKPQDAMVGWWEWTTMHVLIQTADKSTTMTEYDQTPEAAGGNQKFIYIEKDGSDYIIYRYNYYANTGVYSYKKATGVISGDGFEASGSWPIPLKGTLVVATSTTLEETVEGTGDMAALGAPGAEGYVKTVTTFKASSAPSWKDEAVAE